MPYNWFYQKRLLATKVARYFNIKKKKKKKRQRGLVTKALKRYIIKDVLLSVSHSLEALSLEFLRARIRNLDELIA